MGLRTAGLSVCTVTANMYFPLLAEDFVHHGMKALREAPTGAFNLKSANVEEIFKAP